jgi:hypothetical protein
MVLILLLRDSKVKRSTRWFGLLQKKREKRQEGMAADRGAWRRELGLGILCWLIIKWDPKGLDSDLDSLVIRN